MAMPLICKADAGACQRSVACKRSSHIQLATAQIYDLWFRLPDPGVSQPQISDQGLLDLKLSLDTRMTSNTLHTRVTSNTLRSRASRAIVTEFGYSSDSNTLDCNGLWILE